MTAPTLMIQGTSSGAGKTTLVTALCRIFSDEGYRVAPFKSQNMSSYSYIGNDFEIARAQVILVTDIDKGGSFASIIGTMALLEKKYQRLIKGFVINKFRGDIEILRTSFSLLRKKTMKPVLGVIPLLKFDIPDEDSLDAKLKHVSWTKKYMQSLDVEIANLSRKVRKNLDMKALGVLLK